MHSEAPPSDVFLHLGLQQEDPREPQYRGPGARDLLGGEALQEFRMKPGPLRPSG